MKKKEFIALTASAMVLTALGIDVMLPALKDIREHFQFESDSTEASKVISFFFMGQIGQLIFGILSDRMGRLPVLRIGFPFYIIGGLLAALTEDFNVMLAARFIAGMGAAGILTTTVAGVRDRFEGDKMASIMSLVLTIFLLTPMLAPFLGTVLLYYFNWRVVFLAPPVFAIFIFLWSFRLDESLHKEARLNFNMQEVIRQAGEVLSHPTFLKYAGITTILFTAFSSYIASSERIVAEIYHKPEWFSFIFAGMGAIMAVFTYANSYWVERFGSIKTLRSLLIAYVLVGTVLFLGTIQFQDPPNIVFFFLSIALLTGINIAIEPNSGALALAPMGEKAGMAASIYGTLFFFVGSLIGTWINDMLVDGVMPLNVSFLLIGIVCLALSRIKDQRLPA